MRLCLEAGAGQRLVTAWSGYAAWWYAVFVELFVSKGEKAIEVASIFLLSSPLNRPFRGNGKPQSFRAMVANHAGRLLQASATLRDGGESMLGSRLNLL